MARFIKFVVFFSQFILIIPIHGQIRVSGFVRDSITGEVLIGAHVMEPQIDNAVITDNRGYFSINIPVNTILQFTYIGYHEKEMMINVKKDTLVTIELVSGAELSEVVITTSRQNFNVVNITRKEMLLTPSLGATPDLMKTIQLQPGILSQNEGSSVLLVRGGNPGENLYLLDEVPLIYVNHLGGYMSVFNPDMINDLTLYKSGFPSRYGGKLSSVVDITQREGSNTGFKGSFGIGLTDLSLTLEGPLAKDMTWIITGRKTMTDFLMLAATKFSMGDYLTSYGFHDVNGKISWRPNEKNSFHINIYQGDDYLNSWYHMKSGASSAKSHYLDIWGNWLVSLKWNHVVSSQIFVTNSISYTRYRLRDLSLLSASDIQDYRTEYLSSLRDISFRSQWKYQPIKYLSFEFGGITSCLMHAPNQNLSSNYEDFYNHDPIRPIDFSVYNDAILRIMGNTKLRAGARLNIYSTENYTPVFLEPRISFDLGFIKNHLLNISYMRITQNSHLILTSQSFLNNEIWLPADRNVPACRSDQFTAGWSYTPDNNKYSASLEVYYKKLNNLAAYKEGYNNILGDGNWRDKIVTGGTGTMYGAEFLLKKNYGDFSGYITYTWSKAFRTFENINDGKEYTFEYDRPHSGSISLNYRISDKLTLSAVWIYQTGLPYTPVIGRQYTPELYNQGNTGRFYYEALVYGERNSARMKDYHRMDVSLAYNRLTKKRKLQSTWTFSVYNLYNRHNPYYYYYNNTPNAEIYFPEPGTDYWKIQLYQVSFFPILPSLSYKVYFDSSSFRRTDNKPPFKERFVKWLYYEN